MTAPKVSKEMSEQINDSFQNKDIYTKLSHIQNELKAPKNQFNKFGNYKYRSCEDILEALKPLCAKYKATLIIYDEIVMIGDRYYVKAIAKLCDQETTDYIEAYAFARESQAKKGMDDSQVTGATSSYARKYALNGLFNIDDTKDFDTNEVHQQSNQKQGNTQPKQQPQQQGFEQANLMANIDNCLKKLKELGVDINSKGSIDFINKYNNNLHDINIMTDSEKYNYLKVLNEMIKLKEKQHGNK
jgi:hypothetical protein|nr:MAG TPA: ERF superfamily protein [Caudoviricetes sp.]